MYLYCFIHFSLNIYFYWIFSLTLKCHHRLGWAGVEVIVGFCSTLWGGSWGENRVRRTEDIENDCGVGVSGAIRLPEGCRGEAQWVRRGVWYLDFIRNVSSFSSRLSAVIKSFRFLASSLNKTSTSPEKRAWEGGLGFARPSGGEHWTWFSRT